jgi:hypothetical protein
MSHAVARPQDFKAGYLFSERFVATNSWNGYEAKCLFLNLGDGKFADVSRPAGCDDTQDGRGVAIADLNKDGRLDIIINNNNTAPTVFVNQLKETGNWFRCVLRGNPDRNAEFHTSRDAIGARASLTISNRGSLKKIVRWVEAGSGYSSQSDVTLHFGLGDAPSIKSLDLLWPDGLVESFSEEQLNGLINRECYITELTGISFN